MNFDWDEKKRLANLRKHGLDFRDGSRLFDGPFLEWLDVRFDYGEPRFLATGMLNGRVVVAVYAETARAIRMISMRKASKHEETCYFENLLQHENRTIED